MSILAQRLKEARERKGLKQTQVSQHTGINNKTLSRYENGGSEPDTETIKQLAALYEVSVDWLLGRTDNPKTYATKEAFIEAAKEKGLDFSGMTQEEIDMFVRLIKDYRKNKGLD